MALWLVRAGRSGEREAEALAEGLKVIEWDELPDLSAARLRDDLETLCRNTYPNAKVNTVRNWVGQLWAFRELIETGDIVALPLKTSAAVAFGHVTGPYKYLDSHPSAIRHVHTVEWLKTDVPRSNIQPDILNSLGAFMTVCRI